jgi:signal transduction histidine kinase
VNQAYADACGHPPDFFPGKNHFHLYPHEENESIFRHVAETGEIFTAYAKPFEFPDDPGRGVTYWDWTLHPVRDAQGVVEGLIFILPEVTERKRAEDKRAAAEKELVRSNQDLQQFAYVASHDLQEPLRTVTGALQLFEKKHRGKFDKEPDQLIDFAVDGAKRMKALIQDLPDYSRLNSCGQPFELVSIKEVLDQSLLNLKSLMEEKGAEITYDHMPTVMGDPGQLRRHGIGDCQENRRTPQGACLGRISD